MFTQFPGILFIFLLAVFCQQGNSSKIFLNEAFRFDNLLIASKNSDIFFTKQKIEKLKTYIDRFSLLMSNATKAIGRQISVQTVRLLVPIDKVDEVKALGLTFKWEALTWEAVENADIIIDSSKEQELLYKAVHGGACGAEGRYVFIGDSPSANSYQPLHLLREFTKLRWGALSEVVSSSSENPFYYIDETTYGPGFCSVNLPGTYKIQTSGHPLLEVSSISVCTKELNDDTDLGVSEKTLREYCKFEPNTLSADASILSKDVPHFCDNSTNSLKTHNIFLDNPQNKECKKASVAEVLRRHGDFSLSRNGVPNNDTNVTLVLVAQRTRRIVMVLDVSGSMNGSRIANLRRAATLYFKYFVETGAEISIVIFNAAAQVIQPMMKIVDDYSRQNLTKTVQGVVAQGATNIAGGILTAMMLLGASAPYNKSQIGHVILLTDGMHNAGPSLNDTIAAAANTSIVFDTLTISSAADSRMESLANLTGGFGLFSAENAPATTELETAFAKLAERSIGSAASGQSVLLRLSTFTSPIAPVTIESGLTSLSFLINLQSVSNVSTVDVSVQNPSKKSYGISSSSGVVYEIDHTIKTITIKITETIEAGNWTIGVSSSILAGRRRRRAIANDPMDYTAHKIIKRQAVSLSGSLAVVGQISGGSAASISMDVWLRLSTISQVTFESVQMVFAYLASRTGPVVQAVIEATVVPATGSSFSVTLKDDGLSPDVTANDGIYVAPILPYRLTTIGDYGVSVSMSAPVSRVSSAGKFRVQALANGPVTIPPGRAVVQVDLIISTGSLLVSFTSPGNQGYEDGSPANYEIRASNSFDNLTSDFSTAQLLARLPGQTPGSRIQVPLWPSNFTTGVQTNRTLFLSVVTESITGQRSEPSFPKSNLFPKSNPETTTPTTSSTSQPNVAMTTTEKPEVGGWTSSLIAGVCVMACILTAEGIGIILAFTIL